MNDIAIPEAAAKCKTLNTIFPANQHVLLKHSWCQMTNLHVIKSSNTT